MYGNDVFTCLMENDILNCILADLFKVPGFCIEAMWFLQCTPFTCCTGERSQLSIVLLQVA